MSPQATPHLKQTLCHCVKQTFHSCRATAAAERPALKRVNYSRKRQANLIKSALTPSHPFALSLHQRQRERSPPHLLLVFPLGVEASLDAFPGLLEGLPLGALGRVMSAHSHDVGAGEDQHVGHDLWKRERKS